jgi:hypothetical protein
MLLTDSEDVEVKIQLIEVNSHKVVSETERIRTLAKEDCSGPQIRSASPSSRLIEAMETLFFIVFRFPNLVLRKAADFG